MSDLLRDIVEQNRNGLAAALPSVCSAHPGVIAASLDLAAHLGRPIVIEATSNQVNQDGGYTGMVPTDFVAMVHELADAHGMERRNIVFGGDHLGPQAWRKLPAEAALQMAHVMVADYVRAGFTKIHLDCSEGCAGEAACLPDAITAERSAALAATCLQATDQPEKLVFVIGTEVPPPGGARADENTDIPATAGPRAQATLLAHKDAFDAAGIGAAFAQVAGLVVQPGVEFSPTAVHHFPMTRKLPFRQVLADWPGICVEAHSTDYQDDAVYPRLAAEGFAFQKVGPALTFAWRQAVYKLDMIRSLQGHDGPGLFQTMESLMRADPHHWNGHYDADSPGLSQALHFGFADRIRYYWPRREAQSALADLLEHISRHPPSNPLLRQFFDPATIRRAEKNRKSLAQALIFAEVQAALTPYYFEPTRGHP